MKDDVIHGEEGEDLPTIFRREALNMMRKIGLGDNFSYDFMRCKNCSKITHALTSTSKIDLFSV